MKYLSILFLAFSLIMVSCKKEDPAPTKKEMISKTWKTKEVYINGQLSSDPAWSSIRTEVKQNGTYTTTSSSGTNSGVWEFNSDESKIIFDKGSTDEETWEILSLTESQWKGKVTYGTSNVEILWQPS